MLPVAPATLDPDGPVCESHPDPSDGDGEEEPGRDRIERFRPECPGGQVDPEAEREDEATASGEHV
jgi:hypothetical protein